MGAATLTARALSLKAGGRERQVCDKHQHNDESRPPP